MAQGHDVLPSQGAARPEEGRGGPEIPENSLRELSEFLLTLARLLTGWEKQKALQHHGQLDNDISHQAIVHLAGNILPDA